jgi:hypothetical protein
MASNRIFDRLAIFTDYMEPAVLLDEVFQGLSDKEAGEILDHIGAMWDIPEENDEDETDEDEEDEEQEEEEDE